MQGRAFADDDRDRKAVVDPPAIAARFHTETVVPQRGREAPANLVGCAIRRSRAREQRLELAGETVAAGKPSDQSCLAEQRNEPRHRQSLGVRGVPQSLHSVKRGRVGGVGRNVTDDDAPAAPAHPCHLAQHRERIDEVVKRVAREDDVEGLVLQRQRWNRRDTPLEVRQGALAGELPRPLDHRGRDVDRADLARHLRQRARNDASPAGNIEHTIAGAGAQRAEQELERALVANRLGGRVPRCLRRELLDDGRHVPLCAFPAHRAKIENVRAMLFDSIGSPLRPADIPVPEPGPGQLLLRVHACGVCRTDLHLLDGEVAVHDPPRVSGHQVVATVVEDGRRVGVPWLGWTDGTCPQCTAGRENLCEHARFTGADLDGGYAEYMVADERFCLPLPDAGPDEQLAPLLCAGLIGYRALRLAGDAQQLGFYGFGNAAHILAQVAIWQGREVYAFTRPGDARTQRFARELGAVWAGRLRRAAAAPARRRDHLRVGRPARARRAARDPPGRQRRLRRHPHERHPGVPYEILWGERIVRSVANLTRADGHEFLALATQAGVRTHVTTYPLESANDALRDLRDGSFVGAAVLVP